ncbi:MerR family transcriptional regulator [Roseibium sp.]|uniref:MerR family transcriptional regulator n=1 Tax=Roseibium sp. TaxID=1936156 RepID=UPI003A9803C0
MKIGVLSQKCGFSSHTIRYYEKIGLLPRADRDAGGRRNYDASILTWLEFLGRLKATGMPIREMLRYADLRQSGPSTQGERRDLLVKHQSAVRRTLVDLQNNLTVLDNKIATYGNSLSTQMDEDDAQRKPDTLSKQRQPA